MMSLQTSTHSLRMARPDFLNVGFELCCRRAPKAGHGWMVVQSSDSHECQLRFRSCFFQSMNKPNHKPNTNPPEPNVDANTREENQHKPEQQRSDDQAKGHGALKGTDTPATTDAETAEREKGKRTTM
jgi:hypothetical protein